MYLTTGKLSKLITSDANWEIFPPYFLGAKAIVSAKLEEIISVRNAFAHFRPIKQDDVETIKQVTKHVLTTTENVLAELVGYMTTVPTNTNEKWYGELSALGTPHCKLTFTQSATERWVRVTLKYMPPILEANEWGPRHFSINTLKLNAPAILLEHPRLAAEIIYLTESAYAVFRENQKHDISISVSLGFSRQNLINNPDLIKAETEGVLAAIERETDLIRQDNLARGRLISSQSSSALLAEGENYKLTSGEFASGFKEHDPPEWWGHIHLFNDDFISSVDIFPWMPTQIAAAQY
jgi:hypothetical protein